MKKMIIITALILSSLNLFAQSSSCTQVIDTLCSSEKIDVVVGTIAVIFIGLSFYLFSIDNRLKKIEKDK